MSDDKKSKISDAKSALEGMESEGVKRLRKMMQGGLSTALQSPSSQYGGPVRISSGVPLKFPYTYTAKVIQFPWKFYIRHNWLYKYFFVGIILSLPFFKKFTSMANTPENIAYWHERRNPHHHHHH